MEKTLPKEKPCFVPSGILNKDYHNGKSNQAALLFHAPPESRWPTQSFRLFGFKNGQETLNQPLNKPTFLCGRDRNLVDIVLEHPSCSKQHAVFQFRLKDDRVLPYIMDLGTSYFLD